MVPTFRRDFIFYKNWCILIISDNIRKYRKEVEFTPKQLVVDIEWSYDYKKVKFK